MHCQRLASPSARLARVKLSNPQITQLLQVLQITAQQFRIQHAVLLTSARLICASSRSCAALASASRAAASSRATAASCCAASACEHLLGCYRHHPYSRASAASGCKRDARRCSRGAHLAAPLLLQLLALQHEARRQLPPLALHLLLGLRQRALQMYSRMCMYVSRTAAAQLPRCNLQRRQAHSAAAVMLQPACAPAARGRQPPPPPAAAPLWKRPPSARPRCGRAAPRAAPATRPRPRACARVQALCLRKRCEFGGMSRLLTALTLLQCFEWRTAP